MTDPASLAIVGGGASAVFFLAHVALLPDPPSSVTVFDRTGRFGLGIAYGTEEPCHLLNTRACKTSALHADPDHFVRWVAGYGYGPDDYAPRALYATYLQDVLKAATQRLAAAGCRLSFEQAEVRGVNPVPDGYTLSFGEGGQDRGFESVLIATGNVVPIAPTGAGALSPADGYHASPWGWTGPRSYGNPAALLFSEPGSAWWIRSSPSTAPDMGEGFRPSPAGG